MLSSKHSKKYKKYTYNHLDGQIEEVGSLLIDKMFGKQWNFCPE
jgi:hypothetical protein